jgi:AraC-like DNA-binding protein
MQTWHPTHGPLDTPREYETFEAFPQAPDVPGEQLDQWLNALRVQPISAVEWNWAPGWAVGPRVVNDSMWFWFESGDGWGWTGSEKNRFEIKHGDLMLIRQGVPHMVGQNPGVRSHVYAVHFYAQIFGGVNLLELLGFPSHFPGTPVAPYKVASERLAREFAIRAPGWMPAMAADVLRVLFHMIRYHGSALHIPIGTEGNAELLRLLPALELIEQNVGDPELAVGEMAGRVSLGEGQFRKLFRRVTGLSPVRFIQRQRIERAITLLLTTEMSIEHIAESCGFNDTPFFIRVFKARTGLSPSRYRKFRDL